jgi:hypothetical protein
MTTIKTPMPQRLKFATKNTPGSGMVETKHAVNQLIECVAELREVVEKQGLHITNLRGGWTDVEINKASLKQWPQPGDIIYRLNSAGDIIEQPWYDSEKQRKCRAFVGIFKTREEALVARKAIINRLIP